jgi:DNA polymerase
VREDIEGRPFVGRAGRFLNEMLIRAGLSRDQVFITNSVKCRPPRNRPPRNDELKTCKESWLDRQIDLVDPGVIVLLGSQPFRQIFGGSHRLSEVHGQLRAFGGRRYFITYHPAAGMRFPTVRDAMSRDIRTLKRLIR